MATFEQKNNSEKQDKITLHNHIRSLDRCVEEAQKTCHFNFSGRKLKDFPKVSSKFDLSDTTSVDLSKNRFVEIPNQICHYKSLEKLNCYNNLLRCLPQAIVQLQALAHLNISRNQLVVLPPFICQLKNLEVLFATNNRLVSLPEEIGRLEKLCYLDISSNELSHLPGQLSHAVSLKKLKLRRNQLVEIPEEISELQLNSLNLSENRLTHLPSSFYQMKSLNQLNLDNNPLVSPPAQVCSKGLTHVMKHLYLEYLKEQRKMDLVDEMPAILRCSPNTKSKNGNIDSGYNTTDNAELYWQSSQNSDMTDNGSYLTDSLSGTSMRELKFQNESYDTFSKHEYGLQKNDFDLQRKNVDALTLKMERDMAFAQEEWGHREQQKMDGYSRPVISRSDQRRSPLRHEGTSEETWRPVQAVRPLQEEINLTPSNTNTSKSDNKLLGSQSSSSTSRSTLDSSPYSTPMQTTPPSSVQSTPSQGTPYNTPPSHLPKHVSPIQNSGPSISVDHAQNSHAQRTLFVSNSGITERQRLKDVQKAAVYAYYNMHSSPVSDNENEIDSAYSNHLNEKVSRYPSTEKQEHVEFGHGYSVDKLSEYENRQSYFSYSQPSHHGRTPSSNSYNSFNGHTVAYESIECADLRSLIENKLQVKLPHDLSSALRDGVLLCHLANHVRPRSVASIHIPSPSVPKLSNVKSRRNVESFLDACRRLGVDQDKLCDPSEIVENQNTSAIANMVYALENLCLQSQKHSIV